MREMIDCEKADKYEALVRYMDAYRVVGLPILDFPLSDKKWLIEACKKQIPEKVIEYGKYGFKCPCCNEDLGLEREDILIYDMTPPKYCDNCGQMLYWKL